MLTCAIPFNLYQHKVRRYASTAPATVCDTKAAEMMGKDIKDLKIVSATLATVPALPLCRAGSRWIPPWIYLEGLMMGTRKGDIDPGAIT